MSPDGAAISAVVGLVDTEHRRMLLVRRPVADPHYPSHWCFPGGTSKSGETTRQTAGREVLEETGGRRRSTGSSGRSYEIDCFVATHWSGTMVDFPTTEHVEAAWADVDALPALEPMGPVTRWLASAIRLRFGWAETTLGA